MKNFSYDALLDEENICNLKGERRAIEEAVRRKAKLVVYGPRNFGKTSLVKNVILPHFKARHRRSFTLFADFMDVKDIAAVGGRVLRAFEAAFARSFPARHFMDSVKRFLTSFAPQVSIDPSSGSPSLSILPHPPDRKVPLDEIFEAVKRIAGEMESIIVLDEFQDIAFVEGAQGIFRGIFQEIRGVPLIVMGSKRHILSQMLARPDAPLAMFGEDLEFKPIAYEEYHAYILERFRARRLSLGAEDARRLQDAMLRNPEAINMACAEIMNAHERKAIGREEIAAAIFGVVDRRRSRYEEYLSHFSKNEEAVLVSIAREGRVKHPNSASFLKAVDISSRMVGIIVRHLYDRSLLDKDEGGYFLADPLLAAFLRTFR